MSLFYILNTEDYCGEQFQIGDIMQGFTNALYKATGLSLGTYMGPTTEELSAYFSLQNMEYVTEEILWKNLSDDEKVSKILDFINRISKEEKNELIIIDPYLFRKPKENEEAIFESILKKCTYRKIIAVVDNSNTNKSFVNSISEKLDGRLEIKYSDEFHDRFWICDRETGFLTGTSLNGLGKKYCSIQEIDTDDVNEVVKILKENRIII